MRCISLPNVKATTWRLIVFGALFACLPELAYAGPVFTNWQVPVALVILMSFPHILLGLLLLYLPVRFFCRTLPWYKWFSWVGIIAYVLSIAIVLLFVSSLENILEYAMFPVVALLIFAGAIFAAWSAIKRKNKIGFAVHTILFSILFAFTLYDELSMTLAKFSPIFGVWNLFYLYRYMREEKSSGPAIEANEI